MNSVNCIDLLSQLVAIRAKRFVMQQRTIDDWLICLTMNIRIRNHLKISTRVVHLIELIAEIQHNSDKFSVEFIKDVNKE